jgi:hypothetical protein
MLETVNSRRSRIKFHISCFSSSYRNRDECCKGREEIVRRFRVKGLLKL